jgi:hypothetical protein
VKQPTATPDHEAAMKYACLIYQEEQKLEGLSEAEQLAAILADCAAAAAWVEELKRGGHHVFSAGLQSVRTATTVRNMNGKPSMTDGPFAETKECLGGFTIIDARDLNEALQLVSRFRAGLLSVEVRPVMDPAGELTDPVDRKVADGIRRRHPP